MKEKSKKLKKTFQKQRSPLTRAQRIKVRLIQEGISQQQIADELGLTISCICKVIHGKGKSKKVDAWIESHLGV